MSQFNPPPTGVEPFDTDPLSGKATFNALWMQWFINFIAALNASGMGGGGAANHESLTGLQGGTAGEHYHLTSARYTTLTGTQSANQVLAGPTSGAAAISAFRALVAGDLPAGTGTVTSVATGTGLTGGPITTTGTISIASVITAGGPTGSASVVPVITWNAEGQITALTSATITPAAIGAAPTANPTFTGTANFDLLKGNGLFQYQKVDNGVILTIPADYSLVVAGPFVNSGDIVVNGDMVVL